MSNPDYRKSYMDFISKKVEGRLAVLVLFPGFIFSETMNKVFSGSHLFFCKKIVDNIIRWCKQKKSDNNQPKFSLFANKLLVPAKRPGYNGNLWGLGGGVKLGKGMGEGKG